MSRASINSIFLQISPPCGSHSIGQGNTDVRTAELLNLLGFPCKLLIFVVGYHGGSDYYAARLREHLRTLITERFNHLSDAEKANMLEDGMKYYRINHRATINGDPYTIQASKDPQTRTEIFTIKEEFSRMFYEDSFDRPRCKVEQLLKGLARGSVAMMVGGTFLNNGVSNSYKQMIEQAGMDCRTADDLGILPDERYVPQSN